MNSLDTIINNLNTALRQGASGVVCLFTYAYLRNISLAIDWKSEAIILAVIALTIGALLNAIHTGCFNFLFMRNITRPNPLDLPGENQLSWFIDNDNNKISLDIRRWQRRGTEDRYIKSIQREMDKWGANITLLYTSSYAVGLATITVYCHGHMHTVERALRAIATGLVMFALAVYSNSKGSGYEKYLADNLKELTWRN